MVAGQPEGAHHVVLVDVRLVVRELENLAHSLFAPNRVALLRVGAVSACYRLLSRGSSHVYGAVRELVGAGTSGTEWIACCVIGRIAANGSAPRASRLVAAVPATASPDPSAVPRSST